MTITYTNRKGQTYYLHERKDDFGRIRYHFSLSSSGGLATAVPEGYEIYEHPNGQVFCRRKKKLIITAEEVAAIVNGIQDYSDIDSFIVDVRKNKIIVYTADSSVDDLAEFLFGTSPGKKENHRQRLSNLLNHDPAMRFVLIDKKSRRFHVQRYCYLGSIDDWIDLSPSGTLDELARELLPHLGKDSFYDLY